jgi:predicted enzyme related to lactoylglutathione lyase
MTELDRYIPGVPCWIDTTQPDPDAAVAFYRGLFGWEFEEAMPADAEGTYRIGRIRGGDVAAVMSDPSGAPPKATWNTYIWVDDADETAAVAKGAGGTVLTEPFDVMEAGRMAVIADPEGAVFSVWQPRAHRGATIVNEHGSLNFNTLATRDPESARAFYGTVLGWKTIELPAGAMWVLPGYGDHLEALNPGTRAMQEEMNAPEGFIDVVAALESIDPDDAATPAHWGVTFGVDDADAAAGRARDLGGVVLDGPRDAPWTRTAVIEDPQGAVFVASQFVPENRDLPA